MGRTQAATELLGGVEVIEDRDFQQRRAGFYAMQGSMQSEPVKIDSEAVASDKLLKEPEEVLEDNRSHTLLTAEQTFEMEQFDALMVSSHRYPLLKDGEETALGRKIQRGLQAAERLADKDRNAPGLHAADEQLVAAGQSAKNIFIHANLRLVGKFARRLFRNNPRARNYGLMDLYQEGYQGLEHAIDMFDPERGIKFSTYAAWWIKQAMHRAIDNHGATIHIPAHIQKPLQELRRLDARHTDEDEILRRLEVNKTQLVELRGVLYRHDHAQSLDMPLNQDESEPETLGSIAADPASTEFFPSLREARAQQMLLSDRAYQVLNVLESFVTKSEMDLLEKLMINESLTEANQRQLRRLQGLFEHPVVRAKLRELEPERYEDDWRDQAQCIEEPEHFFTAGARAKERTAEVCGNCAVRAACSQFFETQRPEKGRWVDGISFGDAKKARRAKAKARA